MYIHHVREGDHLEETDVDGRIILKWIKHTKIVFEPAICIFIYQGLLRVSGSISGHPQGALVVIKASYSVYKWSVVGCIINHINVENVKSAKIVKNNLRYHF
jgi:hypothetical protein